MGEATLIFKVIDKKTGHSYEIYTDGTVKGFGDDVIIINGITPLLYYAQGLSKKAFKVVDKLFKAVKL